MKKCIFFLMILIAALIVCGCASRSSGAQISATTLPVYEFTTLLCQGTDLSVDRLITDPVSCLHDYSLNVDQVRSAEAAQVIILSGAGLEDFMEDILVGKTVIDSSAGIHLLEGAEHDDHEDDHHHDGDPHIWLSPANAKIMVKNIHAGLCSLYPAFANQFDANLPPLLDQLDKLDQYGVDTLSQLKTRELITFHDGFAYFAEAFDLTILDAVEEESGSEASAQELVSLIKLVRSHNLPAIFTEINGSPSAASVIASETGAVIHSLDMVMSGTGYFDSMYHNIDTIKEALG